jgi:hypothetical protein
MISCSCRCFPLRIYATEPIDCKAVPLRFSMVGTNPYPQPCSAFLAFDVSVQGKAHPESRNMNIKLFMCVILGGCTFG